MSDHNFAPSSSIPRTPSRMLLSTAFRAAKRGQAFAVVLILAAAIATASGGLIPEFLSYKTCMNAPPSFSGCMTNVTADLGQRVVLNCQVTI